MCRGMKPWPIASCSRAKSPRCCEPIGISTPKLSCRCCRKYRATCGGKFWPSLLSSPIDVDKMDYLPRDSLHAGVPYGRNFDQQRLIGSLCLNEAGNGPGDHR